MMARRHESAKHVVVQVSAVDTYVGKRSLPDIWAVLQWVRRETGFMLKSVVHRVYGIIPPGRGVCRAFELNGVRCQAGASAVGTLHPRNSRRSAATRGHTEGVES